MCGIRARSARAVAALVGWLLGLALVLLPLVSGFLGVPASASASVLPPALGPVLASTDCAAAADPGCSASPPPPDVVPGPGGSDQFAAAQLLTLINTDRAAAKLPLLSARADVTAIAVDWSTAMAAVKDIAHNDAYFTSEIRYRLGARSLGENVALNRSTFDAHQRLMASPAHRANLVNPKFTVIGVAVVRDAEGMGYFTEDFLEPVPAGSSPPPAGGAGGDGTVALSSTNHTAIAGAGPATSSAPATARPAAAVPRELAAAPTPSTPVLAADTIPTDLTPDPAAIVSTSTTPGAPSELARGLGPAAGPLDAATPHVPLWLALLGAGSLALAITRLARFKRWARRS
ncbi:MAG: hypothetical protein QOF60_1281 [Actinomycetota bacterium]|jgi:uncharacterized protein YkwD|nr:hypothetical protein [Actinomycetota bacterium]